jgi:hypothetical protein
MSHPLSHHGVPDPELEAMLREIVGPDGAFRHRQHVNLAFLAVRRYGMPEAVDKVCAWIRAIAAAEGAQRKYHHTVSRAWVELVAQHDLADAGAEDRDDPDDRDDFDAFDAFVRRHPALLDKRLLSRHYRSTTLASERARRGWAEPDLVPFPWAA